MGTPDFAVGTLKELIDNQYDVVAVVTQPDKPKGRSKELVFSPVKEEAVKNNIQVLQPERAFLQPYRYQTGKYQYLEW